MSRSEPPAGARREAARLLIRCGRPWSDLSPEDVERGSLAIASDPTYGAEICRAARQYVEGLDHQPFIAAVKAAILTVSSGWQRDNTLTAERPTAEHFGWVDGIPACSGLICEKHGWPTPDPGRLFEMRTTGNVWDFGPPEEAPTT